MRKQALAPPPRARHKRNGSPANSELQGILPLDGPATVPIRHLQHDPGTLMHLMQVLPDWVFLVSKTGVILDCQPPSDYPGSAVDLIGVRLADVLKPAQLEVVTGYIDKAIATGRLQIFTFSHVIDGASHEFQVRARPCTENQVLAVARDVTERHVMAKEILEISNREQMRLGQDLHDSLGQHLTGITFLARALENKLVARGLPEAAEAAEVGRLVLQALAQTRNLARGLFPAELESGGLVQALKDLAATTEKCFRVGCSFTGDGTEISERSAAHHLLRIAQEAISNAVRHSKGKQLFLELRTVGARPVLEIRDTGVGLGGSRPSGNGLGFRIMNYRAQKIRAAIEFLPAEPSGTIVRCTCEPLPSAPANGQKVSV